MSANSNLSQVARKAERRCSNEQHVPNPAKSHIKIIETFNFRRLFSKHRDHWQGIRRARFVNSEGCLVWITMIHQSLSSWRPLIDERALWRYFETRLHIQTRHLVELADLASRQLPIWTRHRHHVINEGCVFTVCIYKIAVTLVTSHNRSPLSMSQFYGRAKTTRNTRNANCTFHKRKLPYFLKSIWMPMEATVFPLM